MADWNQSIIDEFRANEGTVQTMGFGRGLVLLHHLGAKSATKRVSPLAAMRPEKGVWLIAASKGGAPEHPAWFHNLIAHPEVEIEDPDEGTVRVTAEVLTGEERDSAWRRFEAFSDGFAAYQRKTSRVIPVVALRRAS
ncbi:MULTISPECIES: nitroreductase/quinone reductase family protein [unclassified Microbacterium]|uniref:nitroreductase/quinone reductase family protein n=1 Tax=unclassified Microbacterium TaxID=2609290 RepID=UPI00097EDBC7|nr:nitroreductase/quinone reductase family protein [Microbacterium sp. JB110]RCS62688.1 nitroreductase family deazaflavin-dependent oxidoreductase [Microbacterium sp. JB110]SJM63423.1 AclJ [Frigoribacterium sp. JB110]